MTLAQQLSPAEAAVLDAHLPKGLTDPMRDLAWCLFQAMALMDPRAGQPAPDAPWQAVLHTMARVAVAQLLHVSQEMGGYPIYLSKGVSAHAHARHRVMFEAWQAGTTYEQLATRYDLTLVRVRQIIGALREEWMDSRQHRLPGVDDD